MSNAEQSDEKGFFVEFLDDYFAESEEHLTAVRRNLLALESSIGHSKIDAGLVDNLLRSFHSLKGISGMVGMRSAEQLSHNIESFLRGLAEHRIQLERDESDALIAATRVLESVIAARRLNAEPVDVTAALERLATASSQIQPAHGSPQAPQAAASYGSSRTSEDENVAQAVGNGLRIWRVVFTPSAELSDRGINVNTVRARMEKSGQLLKAVPQILDKGKVAFEFLVACEAHQSPPIASMDDGLSCEEFTTVHSPKPQPSEPRARRGAHATAGAVGPAHLIRVDLNRLDAAMRMLAELVVSRSQLDERLKACESELPPSLWEPLQEANVSIERRLRALGELVMRSRMVPIGEVFERMEFVARDLAREFDKRIVLRRTGEHTEIDKVLVERIMDPIMHLVRNAVSHGIEAPNERLALGKAQQGTISLNASAVAGDIIITVEDDGRGIDVQRIVARAQRLGLIESDKAAVELLDVLCAPGFSIREEADLASGRGVGMAMVKDAVAVVGGSLELDTRIGLGSKFTIRLPVTLAVADVIVVSAGGQKFAVPQSMVREVIEIDASEIRAFEGSEIIAYREGTLPLIRLTRLFGLNESSLTRMHAFVIGTRLNSAGVVVDRILGQREIVVRGISDPVIQVEGIAGATDLGDGRIVLILDPRGLVRRKNGNRQKSGSAQAQVLQVRGGE